MSLYNIIFHIAFCLIVLASVFCVAAAIKGMERKRRVQRLEDDQRYINNKRNGWDW